MRTRIVNLLLIALTSLTALTALPRSATAAIEAESPDSPDARLLRAEATVREQLWGDERWRTIGLEDGRLHERRGPAGESRVGVADCRPIPEAVRDR